MSTSNPPLISFSTFPSTGIRFANAFSTADESAFFPAIFVVKCISPSFSPIKKTFMRSPSRTRQFPLSSHTSALSRTPSLFAFKSKKMQPPEIAATVVSICCPISSFVNIVPLFNPFRRAELVLTNIPRAYEKIDTDENRGESRAVLTFLKRFTGQRSSTFCRTAKREENRV